MSITFLFKDSFFKYINSGISDIENSEEVRKVYLINIFTFIGILFVFPLGLNALFSSLYPLASALLAIGVVLIINYIYLKISHNQTISSYAISTLFFYLMLYLLYSGGVSNTGPLWLYALPIVFMFLLGFKEGFIFISMFLLITAFMLFFTNDIFLKASYPQAFKIRLMLSLTLVTFLSLAFEYVREHAYLRMRELSKKLEDASMIDHLTEIYNRRGIHKALEKACVLYETDEKVFSLIMCDIDHFKNINDTHGHMVGDEILKKVALEIQDIVRKDDIVARWGGEEFLILLPHADMETAYHLGERIRETIENTTFNYDEKVIAMTVSIGLSEKNNTSHINNIINKADEHMYQAKKEGRNIVYPDLDKRD